MAQVLIVLYLSLYLIRSVAYPNEPNKRFLDSILTGSGFSFPRQRAFGIPWIFQMNYVQIGARSPRNAKAVRQRFYPVFQSVFCILSIFVLVFGIYLVFHNLNGWTWSMYRQRIYIYICGRDLWGLFHSFAYKNVANAFSFFSLSLLLWSFNLFIPFVSTKVD